MRIVIALLPLPGLAACAGKPTLKAETLSRRKRDLEEFLNGRPVASGQFQDLFGAVLRGFGVDIAGSRDGQTLSLVEDFAYEDDSIERRLWTLAKTGEQTWGRHRARRAGRGQGRRTGRYVQLAIPDRPASVRWRVADQFRRWMWLLGDDRLLNRAYMRKFGIGIGEVIIVFEKLR